MKTKLAVSFVATFICFSAFCQTQDSDPDVVSFELEEIKRELRVDKPWVPFLQGKNLLTGLYRLKAGTTDRQSPHDTDEVYYVIEGKSQFEAGEETMEVSPGQIIFVKANVAHRFFDISEDLVVLVFFDQ